MSNLPEKQETALASLGGQAALFDDPRLILKWDDAFLRSVAVNIGREGGSILAQIRRAAGLVAWGAWHRFSDGAYGQFVEDIAESLGVDRRTVERWRDSVVKQEDLEKPALVAIRSDEAKARAKLAGQRRSSTTLPSPSKPIPAASKLAPAEQSEEAGERTSASAPSKPSSGALGSAPPSSDPSPEGATDPHPVAPSGPPTLDELVEKVRNGIWSLYDDDFLADCDAALDQLADALRAKNETALLSDAEGSRWLQSKSAQEWRSLGDPLGPSIRAGVRFVAESFGFLKAEQQPRRAGYSRKAGEPEPNGQVKPDPANCKHPRESRRKLPYMTLCGVCEVKL